ncbi:flavodoxin-dependent (E)-4-hydroxy-3-methylbut-2-enyl-diphosphate synthase [Candidatus Woesearchaeota archaeon]|nr:flavodoxin-dependent (E)-4-hydroxy-3-methylbut-2-enyl-diphosphate synthase [Candidatus Woesearchaeota archaeon]
MKRRESIEVQVGKVGIGADNPIRIQSMTNTPTSDVDATVSQIIELIEAGSELVRFTVKDFKDAEAVPKIKEKLEQEKYDAPLIGDFHYNGHLLLKKYPEAAQALDKLRINPGNVGFGNSHDSNFKMIIDKAIEFGKPVRIGVNFGSIDQRIFMRLMDENSKKEQEEQKSSEELVVEAMCQSAVESENLAKEYGMKPNKIILSAKVSDVSSVVNAYTELAKLTKQPLHLGLTEAGMGEKGIIATAAALSTILNKGIGDTIRVSLTPRPGASRTEEVKVAQQILQANGLRSFLPSVTSCPGCGRTSSALFQEIAEEITEYLQKRAKEWKKAGKKGFEEMRVAVMGCVVNGLGESRNANIGLSLPGSGEDPVSPVYADGKEITRLHGETRISDFKKLIEEYVENHY